MLKKALKLIALAILIVLILVVFILSGGLQMFA